MTSGGEIEFPGIYPLGLSAPIDHPSGFLALSPRNQRFASDGIKGFIAYREQGRHLVAFGGVHAPASSQAELLDRFLAHAASRDRRVIVVQLREPQIHMFLDRGFTVNQLGTSFALTLRHYSLRGTPKMQLRNKISRARKAGLRVVEVGRDVPRDAGTFAHLHVISAKWLEGKGRKELDFMVGEIGDQGDSWRRIFVVRDGCDRAVGFITYVPVWGKRPGYLHDLTRRVPTAPPGAMELCNAYAIERMISDGVEFLHFGFTPFIVDGEEYPGASRVAAWAVRLLHRYGKSIYPAESQAQYKLKWGPGILEREYLAARPLSIRSVIDLLFLTRSI
jgi:lysylphosphatidylglycerol synthetase-like protein (DUF2156 family)